MGNTGRVPRLGTVLDRGGRAAVVAVLVVAALGWAGWATGNHRLTQVSADWPPMAPWAAVLSAALAAAILLQWGSPPPARVWAARVVVAATGVLAAAFLLEYLIDGSSGLHDVFFAEAVRTLEEAWQERPSPRTAASVLLIAVAVGLTRVDRRWTRVAWPLCLVTAMVEPVLAVTVFLFDAVSTPAVAGSAAISIPTAVALLLLVAGTFTARPDRNPVAWLLTRPDGWALLQMVGIIAGLPIVVVLSRLVFLGLGLSHDGAWALSVILGAAVIGAAAVYFAQRERRGLQLARDTLTMQRAEAEARYRMIAENAVDIVVHLRGNEVEWISPSVEAGLGDPPAEWIGSDLGQRVHPDDLDAVVAALIRIGRDESARARFRLRTADGGYRWFDGHGKSYVDVNGHIDGVIAALRNVDEQVEAERRLERLARFDALTGLLNRSETITRFNAALQHPRSPGAHLGVLFCDIDHFKEINDTWGHPTGDVVLTTIAARIRDSVRQGDIVGRMGGDELLVLLPGVHNLDEVAEIAEKIRSHVDEPIHHAGLTLHATLSIGATIADTGDSGYALMARADVAMYRAKRSGRNSVTRIAPTDSG